MYKKAIVLLIVFLSISASSVLGLESDKVCYDFLRAKFNEHDRRLTDFLKTEIASFLNQYPNSELLPEALILQAMIFNENREDEVALAILLKAMFLFPSSEESAEINDFNARSFLIHFLCEKCSDGQISACRKTWKENLWRRSDNH